jgi:glucose/arabinose dehydrogenase
MQARSFVAYSTVISMLLVVTACATQETKAPTPAAAPAPAPQVAPAAPPAAAKAVRNPAEIQINELLDDPKKLEVFRKHAAIVADNPQISQARGMTLGEVAGYATEILTPAVLKAIADDLSKL